MTAKQLREELGKTYDPTNPKHGEFAEALEAIGSSRDKFWHPNPRYVWKDKTKNGLIERVKMAKQVEAAKTAPPVAYAKTSVQKIMDSLGPQFDPSLPAHQDLKAKVEALTPRRTEGYRVAPEHQEKYGTVAHSKHVWWVKDKTAVPLTTGEADELHRGEVASKLDDLFAGFKGDRTAYVSDFKKALIAKGL